PAGSSGGSGGPLDRLKDSEVPATAADVAVHGRSDLRFGRMGVRRQQGDGGDDHAGNTESALEGARIGERLLNRVQPVAVSETFDGRDRPADRLRHGSDAGTDRDPVDEDLAGSALAFAAAVLGAGEPELFAKYVEQTSVPVESNGMVDPVYPELGEGRRTSGSLCRPAAAGRWPGDRFSTCHKDPQGTVLVGHLPIGNRARGATARPLSR